MTLTNTPWEENKVTSVKNVYEIINQKYPYCIQEPYDNSGIMADCGKEIKKIVVSLDITNSVVDYAISSGAQLIVSHHPIIFKPIKCIKNNTPLCRMIQAGISAISAHTNFDIADGGVNDELASCIGLQNIEPVFMVSECDVNSVKRQNFIGRAGNTPAEMLPKDFATHTARCLLGRTQIEYVDGGRPINRVAVGGGACGEFIFECAENHIDAFVSGEVKHHEMIFAKENGITLIAAGHYATESVALGALADTIKNALPEIEILITKTDNPISFTN